MDNQTTPLGRTGFLVLPIGVLISVLIESFWSAVSTGAVVGLLIANVRAVLYVREMREFIKRNPLLGLQAKVQGVDAPTQIRFVFFKSLIGAIVFAAFTALAAGVALLIR